MRLFLDANVIFTAAHNPDGKAAFIIQLGGRGHWTLLTSDYVVAEVRRNMAAKCPSALPLLDGFLSGISVDLAGSPALYPAGLVEKDRQVFQAALASRATHLLTGDLKHFGFCMNRPDMTFGIVVQTVADFLESVRAGLVH